MIQSIPDDIKRILTLEYLEPIQPSINPTGHILGGQPAAGKSSLIERLKLIHKYNFVTIS